ncbi:MAG: GMC family oxidoreductase N-terminal domain-containing protein [Caulobacteraceae bacterium]
MAETGDPEIIVTGGGSAGCAMAGRLAAAGVKVLLLEAGKTGEHIRLKIPALVSGVVQNPSFDWKYYAEPDPTIGGRSDVWPGGKRLGGGSSINGMLYVRGHQWDYDHWAELGATGWSFKDVVPYFRRTESNSRGGGAYRGDFRPGGRLGRAAELSDHRRLGEGGAGLGSGAQPRPQRRQARRGDRLRPEHPEERPAQPLHGLSEAARRAREPARGVGGPGHPDHHRGRPCRGRPVPAGRRDQARHGPPGGGRLLRQHEHPAPLDAVGHRPGDAAEGLRHPGDRGRPGGRQEPAGACGHAPRERGEHAHPERRGAGPAPDPPRHRLPGPAAGES